MCGIIGYVGPQDAARVVMDGLKRMEYRGYDSAGIALGDDGHIVVVKRAGKLANLAALLAADPPPACHQGIGHTRWATHGGPTDRNAHPHVSADQRVALVHNGIIENFAPLRAELEAAGVEFVSQTDSEVASQLLARELAERGDLASAMRATCARLTGAFTLVAIDAADPGHVVAARRNSPLVIGIGRGENFLASDVTAFIEHTREAIELGQDQVVRISATDFDVTDFDGAPVMVRPFQVNWDAKAAEKAGYDWFMRKEIFEQPRAVADTLLGRTDTSGNVTLDELNLGTDEVRRIRRVVILAAGTAYYASLVTKYAIERWAHLACQVELASEFRYSNPVIDQDTLTVTISQSGETADTLMAIRHAREMGSRVIAICNTVGATIPRESDAVVYTRAGPEIGVASTKGFTTQLVAGYLLALWLAQARGVMTTTDVAPRLAELAAMPALMQQVLDHAESIYQLAHDLAANRDFLFLGRHVGFPIALEGALKLKEIAYLHSEGFAAGELKHGPIAIVSPATPVFVIVPPPGGDQLHDKVVSNIQEIRARGARVLVLAESGDASVAPYASTLIGLPACSTLLQPLLAVLPMQLFACEIATVLGHDVDQPRNLAKSVTVE